VIDVASGEGVNTGFGITLVDASSVASRLGEEKSKVDGLGRKVFTGDGSWVAAVNVGTSNGMIGSSSCRVNEWRSGEG
jgi:hypothetical protein